MRACLLALGVLSLCPLHLRAAALPIVSEVEWQPFVAQVRRLIEATDYLGTPFSAADKAALYKDTATQAYRLSGLPAA